ncbi:MAG: hypothetical protein ACFUZC_10275 [Chthoniobacteraceae bacterium]
MHDLPPRKSKAYSLLVGFSLLELLTAMMVFSLIMLMLFSVIGQTSKAWQITSSKIDAYQGARVAFDMLTRNLSQATLNTYLDYDDPATPTRYLRKSELAFVTGQSGTAGLPGTPGTGQAVFFQAPTTYTTNTKAYGGMDGLLNACGYYVSFTANTTIPPHISAAKQGTSHYRYRLMQLMVAAENNKVYTSSGSNTWFTATTDAPHPVTDNVIALIIRAQDPSAAQPDLSANYTYDSQLNATAVPQPLTAAQLPPVLQVTMVAIDESCAKRIENGSDQPAIIETALAGKFQIVSQYDIDLKNLEAALLASHMQYRILFATVPLRESKWTK